MLGRLQYRWSESLRSIDTVSIVSFETKARVEVPSIPATDLSDLERSIVAIPLGKETDLFEGLRLAWQQVLPSARRPRIVSRQAWKMTHIRGCCGLQETA